MAPWIMMNLRHKTDKQKCVMPSKLDSSRHTNSGTRPQKFELEPLLYFHFLSVSFVKVILLMTVMHWNHLKIFSSFFSKMSSSLKSNILNIECTWRCCFENAIYSKEFNAYNMQFSVSQRQFSSIDFFIYSYKFTKYLKILKIKFHRISVQRCVP